MRQAYFSTMFFCLRIWWISAAVAGPWSFWPFSSSFSNCSIVWTEKVLDITVPQIWEGINHCHLDTGRSYLSLVLCLSWRRPPRSCGCARRSRSWWGRPHRSSPGRWRGRRGIRCRRPGRSWSSPSGRGESRLPWCCRRIPGHHRSLLPPLRCSAASGEAEMLLLSLHARVSANEGLCFSLKANWANVNIITAINHLSLLKRC